MFSKAFKGERHRRVQGAAEGRFREGASLRGQAEWPSSRFEARHGLLGLGVIFRSLFILFLELLPVIHGDLPFAAHRWATAALPPPHLRSRTSS